MKTYKIECEGNIHEIGLDDEGYLHALDHDEDHERVLADLGEEVSECVEIILMLEAEASGIDTCADRVNRDLTKYVPFGHPAYEAVLDEDIELIKLIDDIADDEEIRTMVFRNALELGRTDMMKLMYERGLYDKQHTLNSSLFLASKAGLEELSNWLISYGADKRYIYPRRDKTTGRWVTRKR